MKTGKAILAVLAGIAAGAALGVLFAPNKGSDTRKKISKRGESLADALNDKIDERFDELLSAVTGKVKRTTPPSSSAVNKSELVG